MAGSDRKRTCWPTSAEIWCWSAAVLVCIGCQRAPAPAPFHRFVEDVVPGDRWHETKVHIGRDTRNVLSAPYRSQLKRFDVAQDGTIPLGAVAHIDKISADATGISIRVQPVPSSQQSTAQDAATHVHVPVPPQRDVAALAETKVAVLPAGEPGRKVGASAREVLALPREHVTSAVRVPQSARLDFGIGIEGETAGLPPSGVRFTVEVERGQERDVLFSQTLQPEPADDDPGWIDASVDLSDLAGATVRFVLRAERGEQEGETSGSPVVPLLDCSPVWSSPILYSAEPERTDNRPNVILISLDTLRADHLGCYGYHRDTSPNIDRFAQEAFLFENCIAPSSWTLPSHASVFTGLHPSVHEAALCPWAHISEAEITLGELARESGYLTAAYTEGVWVRAAFRFAQGFEQYSDGEHWLPRGSAGKTFENARAWLRKYGRLPFFLFVHTYQIHGPYRPPGRFGSLFDTDYTGPVGKKVFGPRQVDKSFSEADIVHLEALYDGEIAYTDEVLGNLLDELREMGLLENAVVIIFSDHGEEFREHGGLEHGRTLYDEVLRVPLIIRLAGNDPPAGRTTRQVSLTDLYATVLELLGIDHDIPADCMSLGPLMGLSKSRKPYDRKVVASEHGENRPGAFPKLLRYELTGKGDMTVPPRMRSIRTDREKYIISERDQTEELYNVREDPGEKNDVAPDKQPRAAHYRGLLKSFLKSVSVGHTSSPERKREAVPLTEDHKRRLKALGYM